VPNTVVDALEEKIDLKIVEEHLMVEALQIENVIDVVVKLLFYNFLAGFWLYVLNIASRLILLLLLLFICIFYRI